MGCQSSKQSENAKTKKSKLSKLDANENAKATPNTAAQPVIGKLQPGRNNKEAITEKETFSSEEVGNDAQEPAVNRSGDLKVKTIVSRSVERNEEAISNWNQSKKNKLHKHKSEQSANNKGHKYLDEKLSKKYTLNNAKQLQIRTKTKRSRADPEDDTLYEVPLKMPEFDLVPSRSEDSVA